MTNPERPLSEANAERPLSEVYAFIKKGADIGVYNASQTTNMSQALKLALDQARGLGVDTDQLTVAEAAASLEKWLQEYGRNSKASAQSIATYNGRGKKLLDDFVKWSGGDHMVWKKTIMKSPRPAKKSKPRESEAPPATPINGINGGATAGDAGPGEQVHLLRLPGGGAGRLILPQPISLREINAAWKQLTALKTLLVTQAEIEAGTDEEGDDEAEGRDEAEN
jgi:hypothetical protein